MMTDKDHHINENDMLMLTANNIDSQQTYSCRSTRGSASRRHYAENMSWIKCYLSQWKVLEAGSLLQSASCSSVKVSELLRARQGWTFTLLVITLTLLFSQFCEKLGSITHVVTRRALCFTQIRRCCLDRRRRSLPRTDKVHAQIHLRCFEYLVNVYMRWALLTHRQMCVSIAGKIHSQLLNLGWELKWLKRLNVKGKSGLFCFLLLVLR